MLDKLAGHPHYCFLDDYSGYNQIAIAPEDQEKTTFTCPYGTFSFRVMPFEMCNALWNVQCSYHFSKMNDVNILRFGERSYGDFHG